MLRHPLPTLLSSACLAALVPHAALAADPIKIGVIAEAPAVAGSSIAPAAQLAADEINAKGGINGRKIEVVVYDNHSSAAESVRAFQAKGDPNVHGLKTGAGYITGLMLQWQDGKQVNIWPKDLAVGKLKFPAFVKVQ